MLSPTRYECYVFKISWLAPQKMKQQAALWQVMNMFHIPALTHWSRFTTAQQSVWLQTTQTVQQSRLIQVSRKEASRPRNCSISLLTLRCEYSRRLGRIRGSVMVCRLATVKKQLLRIFGPELIRITVLIKTARSAAFFFAASAAKFWKRDISTIWARRREHFRGFLATFLIVQLPPKWGVLVHKNSLASCQRCRHSVEPRALTCPFKQRIWVLGHVRTVGFRWGIPLAVCCFLWTVLELKWCCMSRGLIWQRSCYLKLS